MIKNYIGKSGRNLNGKYDRFSMIFSGDLDPWEPDLYVAEKVLSGLRGAVIRDALADLQKFKEARKALAGLSCDHAYLLDQIDIMGN